ncbi:MAG: hypothetical protein H0S79_11460 [Anaerolineaceae bacterium]|nr:hypothetical protein [Anaerolineaceae bacterium]
MPEFSGWILDLFEDPRDGLVLYVMAENGGRYRLTASLPVTFYALGKNAILRDLWKYIRATFPPADLDRASRMDVFKRQPVTALAVTAANPYQANHIFRQIEECFPTLDYADVDIPVSLRFAFASNAYPLAYCQFKTDDRGRLLGIDAAESPWDIDLKAIPFRTLLLIPNASPNHENPKHLTLVYNGIERICRLDDWKAALECIQSVLVHYDPDLILTDWGDTWLLPMLLQESKTHHIPLHLNREPGREVKIIAERTYHSYGQIVHRGQQIHLFGRCHIDRMNAVLWNDYGLEGTLEACRVSALPLQTSSRTSPGTGISAIEMLTALRGSILVPYQKQQAEIPKPLMDLFSSDQGGMIYQPIIGLHQNVAMVDFTSMYPAIMVTHNISPETILTDGEPGNPIPSLTFSIDGQVEGLVPKALRPLLEKRIQLKRLLGNMTDSHPNYDLYRSRASALKWLLVVCFGYLGYKNAKYGLIEAHQAVTAYSREALLRAKEAAEDLGFEIIHMYVDGLWVKHPDKTKPADMEALLYEIQSRTGLPIALDGIFRWVVFVGSRQNKNRPVANRYFGTFQDGSIKVRGIDARRHDCTPFIAETQLHLLEMMAQCDDPEEALPDALAYLRQQVRILQYGALDPTRLLVKQKLGRTLSAYRTLSPVARAATQLKSAGKELRPGEKVAFIFTLGKPGVFAWDLPERLDPRSIDTERYKTLLLRAAGIVLETWGLDEEKLQRSLLSPYIQLPLPFPGMNLTWEIGIAGA